MSTVTASHRQRGIEPIRQGIRRSIGLAALCAVLTVACADDDRRDAAAIPGSGLEPTAPADCEAKHGIRPVCGFRNPEDLVVVPGGELLLVSEMGTFLTDGPGMLSLLDIAAQERRAIGIEWDVPPSEARWGEPDCPAPQVARFSPHGISLVQRTDDRHQLLVVNHGDERIEFFELTGAKADWQLHWRGCATPPGDPFINDVAGLPGGGFVATHMWDKGTPFEELVARLTAGEATGWVWEWQSDTGFSKIPGSDDLMPNGIAASPDGRTIFVNIYMGNRTVRIDLASGRREGEFSVPSPDNIVFGADGQLWVASHLNDPIEESCEEGHSGPCLLPFQVVRADPETMEAEVVFQHDGAPMGFATVALPHAGRIWLGTASGDRLASIELR